MHLSTLGIWSWENERIQQNWLQLNCSAGRQGLTKKIHRKSGKWRPQDDLVWSFLFIWEVLQIGVAQKPVGFPKKQKPHGWLPGPQPEAGMSLMDVTAALTRLKAFCNPLAKKQSWICPPPSFMASIQSERFFVRLSRSNFVFSYQSQVVQFCLLMSLPHVDDEVRITRVSTILLEWPPGWFWGCCDPFAELLTHGFSMIRTLIEIGWNWSPQKRDGANALKGTHLGKTYDFPMGQEGYLDPEIPAIWVLTPPCIAHDFGWRIHHGPVLGGLLPNLDPSVGDPDAIVWDHVGPEGWRFPEGSQNMEVPKWNPVA